MQGPLKISCVCVLFWGQKEGRSVVFIIFSKKALFQKRLKTQVWTSLFTFISGPDFPVCNIRALSNPASQSLEVRGVEQGQGLRTLGFLARRMRSPGEAEGLFLWEMAPAPSPLHLLCTSLLGIQLSWSGLTLWAMEDTSGALSPLCPCLEVRSLGQRRWLWLPANEVISEVGR